MNKNRIFAIVLRHLYVWPRGLERFMWSIGWPLLDLIMWGITTSYFMKNTMLSPSITTIILGGIIYWGFVSRAQLEISVTFLEDMWNKNIINIFSSPVSIYEYIIATVLLGIIKFLISAGVISLVALIFYNFNILIFGWYVPVFIFNLIFFAWIYGIFVTGIILRFGRSIEEFAWSGIFFLQPFMCVFYPVSYLPSWAQKISDLFPPAYIFEEMRSYITRGQVNWDNLLISTILNVFYLIFSLLFLYKMFERARISGRLTKLEV